MPRIHFYHVVLWTNPTTGDVEPLENIEGRPFEVGEDGLELPSEGITFGDRTGGSIASNLSDLNGVIQYYLQTGVDYNVHMRDLTTSPRIDDFVVGVNGTSGSVDTHVDTLETDVNTLQADVNAVEALVAALTSAFDTHVATPIVYSKLAVALQKMLIPTGVIMPYGGADAPGLTGPEPWPWRICNGAVLPRILYPDLFGVLSTEFNIGGETASEFRLPDLRGRVPVGVDSTANRLSPSAPYLHPDTLGDVGGFESHQLLLAESSLKDHVHAGAAPSHSHSAGSYAGPAHSHGPGDLAGTAGATGFASIHRTPADGGSVAPYAHTHGVSITAGNTGGASATALTGNSGGPSASAFTTDPPTGATAAISHNNMPPYQVTQYMIKT